MLSTCTFGLVDMWMVNTHILIVNITVHGENDSRLLRPIFSFFVRRRPLVAVVSIATAREEVRGSRMKSEKSVQGVGDGWSG